MKNTIKLIVENDDKNLRVDVFINKKEKSLSRTRIKNLILKKKLKINGITTEDPSKKVLDNQKIAYSLPLVYIFEEARSILIDQTVNYKNIMNAFYFNGIYLIMAISLFYYSFGQARKRGTLINIGE